MNIIFQINGGLGKSVMATAVCHAIKTKYPENELIVISSYPDVFINNPNVNKCISHNEIKYFYKDYISGGDFLYFGQEPYLENSYIKQEKNLIETWCELFNLPVTKLQGEMFLTNREMEFYIRKHDIRKPVMILQTSGASGEMLYNWTRDIPQGLTRAIINYYKKEYQILHVRKENQISYEDTTPFLDNIRAIAVMMAISDKRIMMDSSCQHIAAALDKPSNVLWIGTSPNIFGYEIHNNIVANPETKIVSLTNSFLTKYDLVGNISDFPYNNEREMFDVEQVLNSIK